MTETQANAYLSSLDSSWEFNQDAEEGDYYAKDTADGNAYVLIYSDYYEDDTSTFYIVYQYGEYEGGVITVAEAVSKTTITVHWYATFASEESQYHPVVKVGDSADAVSTNVACNEGTTINGTLGEGVKEYYNDQDRDVYAYTTTYTISGHSYFSIAAPNFASYIKDIVIS